jgi:ParB family chromosome partitioning protein
VHAKRAQRFYSLRESVEAGWLRRFKVPIREVQAPLSLNKDNVLLAGLRRLEAVKLLGWQTVACSFLVADELQQKLWHIDENLMRQDLTALERAEGIAERKRLYEELHPETKHGGTPGAGRGKGRKAYKGAESASFQEDTAK